MENKDSHVSIIGLGYVGLPLAAQAAAKGYDVMGIDVNESRISSLQKGEVVSEDERTNTLLAETSLAFSSLMADIAGSDIVVICVPTPVTHDANPDLGPLRLACVSIGKNLQKGQLIILESTVNPGVTEEHVIPLLEQHSDLKAGIDFKVAYCPERINPGDEQWHVGNIPRVVGGLDDESLERAYAFYDTIVDAEIKRMGSLREAEAVKVVENCFRDINIAFVNELACSFDTLGIDVVNVIDGAATKPFSFMPHYPGCGVGGHCIPVDPYYLISYAKEHGFTHELLSMGREINSRMPTYTVELLDRFVQKQSYRPKHVTVGVLGLSYKANVGDTRESASFEIIKELEKRKYGIETYDPYVLEESSQQSLEALLAQSDVLIVATGHREFTEKLTPETLVSNRIDALIDGRNIFDAQSFKDHNIYYKGIGR